jgi:glucose-6-phosphate 1-dehydrogenase
MALFGATGDLTGRFLLPALARLLAAGRLPDGCRVVGSGQQGWTEDEFRSWAAHRLAEHAGDVDAEHRRRLLSALTYRPVNFSDPATVRAVLEAAAGSGQRGASGDWEDGEPVVAYLALPSRVFPTAVEALRSTGLPAGSRVALEKPFGQDLESARALNEQLMELTGVAGEEAVFRVDHVLAMATVQNLLAVRLANRVLEPVWNGAHVAQVDLLWDETLALEGRASYYDRAGALKDVVQNHLLQVLCLVAMEPPVSLEEADLRDRKVDLLRSIRTLTPGQVAERSRRARYTSGVAAETGEALPAYVDEEGVDPDRDTETFAEIVLEVDNWRWQGTRFRLRAGKALAARRKEVVLHFRPVPPLPFGEAAGQLAPNQLAIGIDGPYDLDLRLTGTNPGQPGRLAPLHLDTTLSQPDLPAYSRVLIDVLTGDNRLSIRGDEAEESWRVLTPVIKGWANGLVPMEEYAAGSSGPAGDPFAVR